MRKALTRTDRTDPIASDLDAYGYAFDYNSGKSAGGGLPRRRVAHRRTAALGRLAGTSPRTPSAAPSWDRERYGPTGDGAAMSHALQRSVDTLLRAFPEQPGRPFYGNSSGPNELQRDYRNLRRAEEPGRSRHGLAHVAGPAAAAGSKRAPPCRTATTRGPRRSSPRPTPCRVTPGRSPTPRATSDADRGGPGRAAALRQAKREAGLVDYGDMVAMAASCCGSARTYWPR
jgi:ATP-dependent helicase/nuclease subunit A